MSFGSYYSYYIFLNDSHYVMLSKKNFCTVAQEKHFVNSIDIFACDIVC